MIEKEIYAWFYKKSYILPPAGAILVVKVYKEIILVYFDP